MAEEREEEKLINLHDKWVYSPHVRRYHPDWRALDEAIRDDGLQTSPPDNFCSRLALSWVRGKECEREAVKEIMTGRTEQQKK